MSKIKAIIFDFDGVIADSVNVKTEAFAELYRPYGDGIMQEVIQYHLEHGGVSRFEKIKYYYKELLHKEISEKEIDELAEKFSQLVLRKVIQAPYIKGAFEFISQHYTLYDCFISSGTPEVEIRNIVSERNINSFFRNVYGSPDTKFQHVRKILDDNGYNPQEVVFIGDATSDRDAAKKYGIHFIARIDRDSQLTNELIKINDLVLLQHIIEKL